MKILCMLKVRSWQDTSCTAYPKSCSFLHSVNLLLVHSQNHISLMLVYSVFLCSVINISSINFTLQDNTNARNWQDFWDTLHVFQGQHL